MRAFGSSEDIGLGAAVPCPSLFLHHSNLIAGSRVFKNIDSGRRTIRQEPVSNTGKVAVNDYYFWGSVCPEMYTDLLLAAVKSTDGRFKH